MGEISPLTIFQRRIIRMYLNLGWAGHYLFKEVLKLKSGGSKICQAGMFGTRLGLVGGWVDWAFKGLLWTQVLELLSCSET